MKSLIVEGVSKRYWVPKAQKAEATESRFDRIRGFFSGPASMTRRPRARTSS
jgi:hypothetical protein